MYKESYSKVLVITAVCLVAGIAGMMFLNADASLTGLTVKNAAGFNPASAVYVLAGLLAGVLLAGIIFYVYYSEYKR